MKFLYLINLKKFEFHDKEEFKMKIVFNDLVGIKCSYGDTKINTLQSYLANPLDTVDSKPVWKYTVYASMSYNYDILMLITFIIALFFFRSKKKAINNLLLPSQRGLSDDKIKVLFDAVMKRKEARKDLRDSRLMG
jgi:hypothetical protein